MDVDVVVAAVVVDANVLVLVFVSNNSIGNFFFQFIFIIPLKLPPRLVRSLMVLDQENYIYVIIYWI